MGRRWGKTIMAGSVSLACAANGGAVAWVVPSYKNARPVWRFAERATLQVRDRLVLNKTERAVEFPGGGWLGIYTADNPVGILGEAFDLVICEEAARIPPDVWQETIMPTLADRDGRAILISTPKGRNWFFTEFQRGLSDGKYQASFTAASNSNPIPNIRKAFELARERVSERTFKQEWLAEFVADGAFFVNVDLCATATEQHEPIEGHSYIIGVDWARSSGGDYTVFCVVDASLKQVVSIKRLSGVDFNTQQDRLKALWLKFNKAYIIAEYNSMGGPMIERLQLDGLPITPFVTTAASKHEIITALELAFDNKDIGIINDPVLVSELNSYEKRERTGIPSYSAPEGMHDDCVMSLALAWHGVYKSGPLYYGDPAPEPKPAADAEPELGRPWSGAELAWAMGEDD